MSNGFLTSFYNRYIPTVVTPVKQEDIPEWAETGLVPRFLYTLFGNQWSPQTVLTNIESGKAQQITKGIIGSSFPTGAILETTGEGATSFLPLALVIIAGLFLLKKK